VFASDDFVFTFQNKHEKVRNLTENLSTKFETWNSMIFSVNPE